MGFPIFPLNWNDPVSGELSKGFKESGYLKDAFINFLSLLGWNPGGEQEIFSMGELTDLFSLEKINKAGARFDPDKTKWFNHHYMQNQDNDALADAFKNSQRELVDVDINYIAMVIGLIKERATFVSDFWSLSHFFFTAPRSYDEKASKKAFKEDTKAILKDIIGVIHGIEDFTTETLQTNIKDWITNNNIGFGKVMMPLRLALVGALQGPDVFDIIFTIGKAETISRIEKVVSNL